MKAAHSVKLTCARLGQRRRHCDDQQIGALSRHSSAGLRARTQLNLAGDQAGFQASFAYQNDIICVHDVERVVRVSCAWACAKFPTGGGWQFAGGSWLWGVSKASLSALYNW